MILGKLSTQTSIRSDGSCGSRFNQFCITPALCSEVSLSCLPNSTFLPPEYPWQCREPHAYCCNRDFCNTGVISWKKIAQVLRAGASSTGKSWAGLWPAACDANADWPCGVRTWVCLMYSRLLVWLPCRWRLISFVLRCRCSNIASELVWNPLLHNAARAPVARARETYQYVWMMWLNFNKHYFSECALVSL